MTKVKMNPELMVVGDSLAQGCRSLSVSETLCSQSYAAIIAASQGWEFNSPDHPQPAMIDLELEARKLSLSSLLITPKRIKKNMEQWVKTLETVSQNHQTDCFDNLAIAGVNMYKLSQPAGQFRADVLSPLRQALDEEFMDFAAQIPNFHIGVNGAYTLNPSAKPEYENMTQMDWVVKRKPKRLIYHCGHNDGIYDIGSMARLIDLRQRTWPEYLKVLRTLEDLPKEISTIVIVQFPRISSVGNLRPVGRIDAEGYADKYYTEFPYPGLSISRKEIRSADEQIKWMNKRMVEVVSKFKDPSRFHIVDTYQILKKYDFKNFGGVDKQILVGGKVIDNRYLHGEVKISRPPVSSRRKPRRSYHFECGGFFSFDGMHPSAVGYAILAIEIMHNLGLVYNKEQILLDAFKNEPLVSRYKSGYYNLQQLVGLADNLLPDSNAEHTSITEVSNLMNRLYTVSQ